MDSKQFWQQALDSQSACNLSGLANFLQRVLTHLRETGVHDTDVLNKHPVVRLVVAQMAHLAYGSFDCGAGRHWFRAYQLARMETGLNPFEDEPLDLGERERIERAWAAEDARPVAPEQEGGCSEL